MATRPREGGGGELTAVVATTAGRKEETNRWGKSAKLRSEECRAVEFPPGIYNGSSMYTHSVNKINVSIMCLSCCLLTRKRVSHRLLPFPELRLLHSPPNSLYPLWPSCLSHPTIHRKSRRENSVVVNRARNSLCCSVSHTYSHIHPPHIFLHTANLSSHQPQDVLHY